MPDELENVPQENIAVVKSSHKSNPFTKLREKLPRSNKKLIAIVLIVLAIPITVGLALVQQDQRSRASGGNGKIFLGINNGLASVDRPLDDPTKDFDIKRDLERIKIETGAYPAVYVLWANLESNNPNLEVLNYLDSKGITPAISLMPKGIDGFDSRRDGRFLLSASSASDGIEAGKIKFDNSNPNQITKIYVSKTSSGTENPAQTLAPTWVAGQTIEIFGTNSSGQVDYEGGNDFKFEILSKVEAADHWILSVRPIKTTPLVNMFSVNKPVFITPSNYLVKKYSNVEIAKGSMDNKFLQIAHIAKQFNKPIIFRYAQEMNTDNYTWSDFPIKFKDKAGYERYRIQDFGNNKDSFKHSWQHIYRKMKPVAPNLQFFWNPQSAPIGNYIDYFPGDSYVDYVGFDAYSGTGTDSSYKSLADISNGAISKLKFISNKPIIVGETGINSNQFNRVSGTYRKKWLTDGYNALAPNVKGILYFDVDMTGIQKNNWLLSASPEISSAYRALLLDPRFQGKFGNQSSPVTPPPSVSPTPTFSPTPTPTGFPAPPSPTPSPLLTAKLNPTNDSYTIVSTPNSNYGTSNVLWADGEPDKRIFLKFDLSFLTGKNINSIKLKVTVADIKNAGSDGIFGIRIAGNDWNEDAITWSNGPTAGATKIATISNPKRGDIVNIDLTQQLSSKKGQVVSLRIGSDNSNGAAFYSKESTTGKPLLIIEYQ